MSVFDDDLAATARAVLDAARRARVRIATAESCTGGLVAALLTEIPGSSDVVDCGFVTYSNGAKNRMVGVSENLLREHGAVSEPVARAMAQGALAASEATLAVSISGVAGPGGGSAAKPVGLVHFACASADGTIVAVEHRFGDIGREAVRQESVAVALGLLRRALDAHAGEADPGP